MLLSALEDQGVLVHVRVALLQLRKQLCCARDRGVDVLEVGLEEDETLGLGCDVAHHPAHHIHCDG